MRGLRTALGVLACALVAACSAPQSPPERAKAARTPAPSAGPAPAPVASIPVAFHGVWWDTLQHCRDGLSDTHLRIEADSLAFHESSGRVTAVQARGPREIVVGVQLQGEGETWVATYALRLSEDGRTLSDITRSPPFVRVRCPGPTPGRAG